MSEKLSDKRPQQGKTIGAHALIFDHDHHFVEERVDRLTKAADLGQCRSIVVLRAQLGERARLPSGFQQPESSRILRLSAEGSSSPATCLSVSFA